MQRADSYDKIKPAYLKRINTVAIRVTDECEDGYLLNIKSYELKHYVTIYKLMIWQIECEKIIKVTFNIK